MITVKVNNGVAGWVNVCIAAEACYNADKTALGGFGSIWMVAGSLRDNMGIAVKAVKNELEHIMRVRGVKLELT